MTPLTGPRTGGLNKLKAPVGPSMFLKPNLPTKKKFQMDGPSAEEQKKFDKIVVQQVKQQEAASLIKRDLSSSAIKN